MNENNDTKETKKSSHVLLKILGVGIVTGATALSVAAILTNANVLDRYGLFFAPSITAEAEDTQEDIEDIFDNMDEEEEESAPVVSEPEPEEDETVTEPEAEPKQEEKPEEESEPEEAEPEEEEPERTPAKG